MIAHVMKWGNSLGLRIPKSIAKQLDIKHGVAIELKVVDHALLVKKKSYSLQSLLNEVTPTNIHKETELGKKAVGKEIW